MDFAQLQELANNYNYASLRAYEPHRYERHIADLFSRGYTTRQIENHLRKHREAKQSRLWAWLEEKCKFLKEKPDQSTSEAVHCSFLDTFTKTKELDDLVNLISMIFNVSGPVSNDYSYEHISNEEERELAKWDSRLELEGTQNPLYPFDRSLTPGHETEDNGPKRNQGRVKKKRREAIPDIAFQGNSVTEHSESENNDTDKPPVQTNPESSETASSTEDTGSGNRDKLQELKTGMRNNRERRRDNLSNIERVLESQDAASNQPETEHSQPSHATETPDTSSQSRSHSAVDNAQLSTPPSNRGTILKPQNTVSTQLEAGMSHSSHLTDSSPQSSFGSATDTPQFSKTSDTSKDLEQQSSNQPEAVLSKPPYTPETPDTSPRPSSPSAANTTRSSTTPSSRRTRSSTKQLNTCSSNNSVLPSNPQQRLLAVPMGSSRLRLPTNLQITVEEEAYETPGIICGKKRLRDTIETVCEDDVDYERKSNVKRQRKVYPIEKPQGPVGITGVLVHPTNWGVETGKPFVTAGTDEELLPDASYGIDDMVGNTLIPLSIAPTTSPPLSPHRRRELRTRRFMF